MSNDDNSHERMPPGRGYISNPLGTILYPTQGPTGSASANNAIAEIRSSGMFPVNDVELMVEALIYYAGFSKVQKRAVQALVADPARTTPPAGFNPAISIGALREALNLEKAHKERRSSMWKSIGVTIGFIATAGLQLLEIVWK